MSGLDFPDSQRQEFSIKMTERPVGLMKARSLE